MKHRVTIVEERCEEETSPNKKSRFAKTKALAEDYENESRNLMDKMMEHYDRTNLYRRCNRISKQMKQEKEIL